MTQLTPTVTPLVMTHHCRECGDEVGDEGFCSKHPNEIVDTIASVHPLRAAVAKAAVELQFARDSLEAAEANDDLCDVDRGADVRAWEAAVSTFEETLETVQRALAGSDCPRKWELREGGYPYDTVTATSPEAALEVARGNVDRSNYSDCKGTLWIDVRVACEETGETDSDSVTLHEEEPDCADDEVHDWRSPHSLVGGLEENPGVHGHGGGVIITEVCRHCGCKRVTDTWAQNRDTGEQGLESVEYEEDAYTSEELEGAFGD